MYIDLEGYYGDESELILVDDSQWTDDDVEEFTQAHNDGVGRTRLIDLANSITDKYKEN